MTDLKDLLGSAVNEAKKHPELLSSVVEFAKGTIGGKEPVAGTSAAKTSSRTAASKTKTGPNERVSGTQVEQALGPEKIEAAAKRAGVSEKEAADGIAELLPAVVDYLTPGGTVSSASETSKRLDALEQAKPATGS